MYWWDRVAYIVKRTPLTELKLSYPFPVEFGLANRRLALERILRLMKTQPGLDLERFLDELAHAAEVAWSQKLERAFAEQLLMTWDHVRELHRAGMDVELEHGTRDPATDVLTRLIQGEPGEAALTATELVHQCIFLLNAGHETTTNLIGNALHALTLWPSERARLCADPGRVPSAVEEFLRFESSNQLGNRITTEPATVGGVALPAGARITLCIGAANRDPAQFAAPDRLDVARTPNRHVAFGFGIHTCAGLNLARLEGRVAIGRFLARFPAYALDGAPTRGGRARFRRFLRLPAVVG